MSVDLILRKPDSTIEEDQFVKVADEISREKGFLEFVKLGEGSSYECHFWKANKCDLGFSERGEVLLSTGADFVPYMNVVAQHLATGLGCEVFDPQESRNVGLNELRQNIDRLKDKHEELVEKTGDSLKLKFVSNRQALPIEEYYSAYEKGLKKAFSTQIVKGNELTEETKNLMFEVLDGDECLLRVTGFVGFKKEADSSRVTTVTLYDMSYRENARDLIKYFSGTLGLQFSENESY